MPEHVVTLHVGYRRLAYHGLTRTRGAVLCFLQRAFSYLLRIGLYTHSHKQTRQAPPIPGKPQSTPHELCSAHQLTTDRASLPRSSTAPRLTTIQPKTDRWLQTWSTAGDAWAPKLFSPDDYRQQWAFRKRMTAIETIAFRTPENLQCPQTNETPYLAGESWHDRDAGTLSKVSFLHTPHHPPSPTTATTADGLHSV